MLIALRKLFETSSNKSVINNVCMLFAVCCIECFQLGLICLQERGSIETIHNIGLCLF